MIYAIILDLDTDALATSYPHQTHQNAHQDIRQVLEGFGFDWQQRGVFFGRETVNAVTCVLAIQALAREYPWFAPSVREVRILRIEEANDLLPAMQDCTRPLLSSRGVKEG